MAKQKKEKEYMSFNDKVALSQVVENLPMNEHPNIFRIIVARDPRALVDCEDDSNWTWVYFDLLRPSTLRELESYIASRGVNTQSEIKENNPDLGSEEKSAEPSEESNPDLEKEKSAESSKGDNPDLEKKEKSAKSSKGDNPHLEKEESAASSSYTAKLRSNKGSQEEAKGGSIKARLRRSSKKSDSDPGPSKQQ